MSSPVTNDRVRPTERSPRGRFVATVVSNTRVCAEHYRLVLAVEKFPPSRPGQFVQIECDGAEGSEEGMNSSAGYVVHEWTPGEGKFAVRDRDYMTPRAFLRRPFSIAGRRERADGSSEIDIIQRVVGKGTRALEKLAAGEKVSVIGPLGNGFVVSDELVKGGVALLVGGGVGIPPMFYLAGVIHALGGRAVGFVGAQRKELVPLTISPCSPAASAEGDPVLNATEFADYGFPTVVTTDDGSMGMKGFVTGAVRKFVEKCPVSSVPSLERKKFVVFCCGPTAMMRATAKLCEELGVQCQVSLEQPMACGMGTCQSCVVRIKKPGDRSQKPEEGEWVYRLTCTDGPVFDGRDVVW